jgi:hypothetical protein
MTIISKLPTTSQSPYPRLATRSTHTHTHTHIHIYSRPDPESKPVDAATVTCIHA